MTNQFYGRLSERQDLSNIKMSLSEIRPNLLTLNCDDYENMKDTPKIKTLIRERVGLFIRIKEGEPFFLSFEDEIPNISIYQRDGLGKMVRVDRGLNGVLGVNGISDDDILNAIKISFSNPHLDGTRSEISDTTTNTSEDILGALNAKDGKIPPKLLSILLEIGRGELEHSFEYDGVKYVLDIYEASGYGIGFWGVSIVPADIMTDRLNSYKLSLRFNSKTGEISEIGNFGKKALLALSSLKLQD